MKKFLLGILIGFLVSGLTAVIVIFAAMRLGQKKPTVPENSLLTLRLEGDIPEAPEVDIPLPFLQGRRPVTVAEHWGLLRRAAADSRIKGLLFMPQGVDAGWAKLTEVREGILAFRKSGKPVYAYLRAPRTREYYLATAADRIYMAPEDLLDLKGLRAELMFFRKTLDKLGVQVEIEHAGKYKDAGDIFTRSSMSPETREVLDSVLDDLYGQLLHAISNGRKQTPEQVSATINQGPFVAEQAKAKGLVDGLLYQDQMFEELKGRIKVNDPKRIAHSDYLKAVSGTEKGRRIAYVVADGNIVRGGTQDDPFQSGFISAAAFTRLLKRVQGDNSVRGAIVRVNSPGGDGFGSDEIWRELNLLSKKKPLVISMSDAAASGGYYIAMTGDPIVAYPGTFTGSIGVIYGKANLRGLYDKLGIQKDVLIRGQFAAIDSDYTPLTPAGRAKLREAVDGLYKSFVSRVATARKRKYEEVDALAQGRVWLGTQAKSNGLVDELGGLDRAVELIKKRAGIPAGEKIQLVPYPPRRSIFEQIMSRQSEVSLDVRTAALLKKLNAGTWVQGGILRIAPYTITVE